MSEAVSVNTKSITPIVLTRHMVQDDGNWPCLFRRVREADPPEAFGDRADPNSTLGVRVILTFCPAAIPASNETTCGSRL